jgi:hypothetical protein
MHAFTDDCSVLLSVTGVPAELIAEFHHSGYRRIKGLSASVIVCHLSNGFMHFSPQIFLYRCERAEVYSGAREPNVMR